MGNSTITLKLIFLILNFVNYMFESYFNLPGQCLSMPVNVTMSINENCEVLWIPYVWLLAKCYCCVSKSVYV